MDNRLAKIKELISSEFNGLCEEQQDKITAQDELIGQLRTENGTVKQTLASVQGQLKSVTVENANINRKFTRFRGRHQSLRTKYDALLSCFDNFKLNFARVLSKNQKFGETKKATTNAAAAAATATTSTAATTSSIETAQTAGQSSVREAQLASEVKQSIDSLDMYWENISDAEECDTSATMASNQSVSWSTADKTIISVAALPAIHDQMQTKNEHSTEHKAATGSSENERKILPELFLASNIKIYRSPEKKICSPMKNSNPIPFHFKDQPCSSSLGAIDEPLNLSIHQSTSDKKRIKNVCQNDRPNDDEAANILLSIPLNLSREHRATRQSLQIINLIDVEQNEQKTENHSDFLQRPPFVDGGRSSINDTNWNVAKFDGTDIVSKMDEEIDYQMEVEIEADDVTEEIVDSMQNDHLLHSFTFECISCKKNFENQAELREHIRKHCGILQKKRVSFQLPLTENSQMARKQSNPVGSPFICFIVDCKKRFTTQSQLDTHLKLHSRKSKSGSQSGRARKASTTDKKPFICTHVDCTATFAFKNALEIHRLIHTGERPYACQLRNCGKTFNQKSNLLSHIRNHSGERPHVCSYSGCHKRFSKNSQLRRHQQIHARPRSFNTNENIVEKKPTKVRSESYPSSSIQNKTTGKSNRGAGSPSNIKKNLSTRSAHKIHIRIQDTANGKK